MTKSVWTFLSIERKPLRQSRLRIACWWPGRPQARWPYYQRDDATSVPVFAKH